LVDLLGGGILCCGGANMWIYAPSSPMIDHCVIANNDGAYGGGIVCIDDSEAVIRHCRIVDNSSGMCGGGIWVYYAYPTISHNIIAHNSAWMGGGISNYLGLPSITNNTIVHNRPNGLELDEAMWSFWDPQPVLVANNILWDNEIYMWQYASAEDYNIRFNDIQGGWEGDGNIDVDPRFVHPENREYRLKSQAGRWDPEIGDWLIDEATSPCIDAGDPQSSVGDEQAPHGALINMGAYGGTPEASKTP
jgi:parallel beta helix pectate lyase-like protein/disaggregatase-related protein